MPDVILNKIQTIQRCLNPNYAKQDSVILNLERASQASIDIATHIIKVKGFGIPNTSRELFDMLTQNSIITQENCTQMKKMVGFRNIAVHDYQSLNLEIVISIVEKHLYDFDRFIKEVFENYIN